MEYFKKAPVFFFLFMLFAAPGSFTVERGAIHLPPVKFLSSDDSIPCFVSFTVSRQYSHSVDLRYGNGCSEQHKKENEKADIQYRINNYKTIGTGFQATGFAVELGGENNPPIDGNISYTRTTNIVNNCCPSGSSTEDLDANGSAGLTVNSDEGQVFLFQYDYESNFGMCSFSVHSLRNPNYKATIKQKDCSGQSSDNDISAMGEATIQALTLAGIQLNNSDNPLNAELEKVGIGGRCEFNKTESGYTIGFTSSRTTQNPIAEGWTGTDEITYVLHVDVGIKFKMKYTAYIEPEGGWDTYKQWLPEGNIKDTDRKAGNSTTFKIKIIDNEHPNEKVNVQVKELHYQLTDVSHVPGVCMNYPDKDPDQKADLSFIDPDNEQNTELADLTYKDLKPAYINSYDFGGSARLTAKITLFSGEELTAITSIDNKNYVNIPFRKDDSKVADYWKKKNHAEDLADNDDNEQSANGVGADYPGDGYTLYEEYRGFRENEKHISTSPAKKDILIFDNSEFKDRTQNGISLFAAVTGIVAHSHFKEDEFGKKEREPGQNEKAAEYETTGIEHNKILNVNNDASLHSVDQYGLLIVSTHKKLGYAKAVRKDKFPATPKGFFFL